MKYLLIHNAASLPQVRRFELPMVPRSLQVWDTPTAQKLEEISDSVSVASANPAAQFLGQMRH